MSAKGGVSPTKNVRWDLGCVEKCCNEATSRKAEIAARVAKTKSAHQGRQRRAAMHENWVKAGRPPVSEHTLSLFRGLPSHSGITE